MTNSMTDFTAAFKDIMDKMPMDMSAFDGAMKAAGGMAEQMSAVALDAASKSTEISATWAQASIQQAGALTKVSADPAEAGKAVTDFASASAELAAENMAAFAEVAKKVQMDAAALIMNAGKTAA